MTTDQPPSNENKSTTLKDLLSKDSEDESLRRYKESLGLTAALNVNSSDPRRIVITAFGVEFPKKDHDPIVRKLDNDNDIKSLKTTPIVIKENVRLRFVVRFRVNNEIVHRMRFKNIIKKGLISVKEEHIMGSYAASEKDIEYKSESFEAPGGLLGRGAFTCTTQFIDGDNKTHLELNYTLKIQKNWEG